MAAPFWLLEHCSRLASNDPDLQNLNLNIRRLNTDMVEILAQALEGNTVLHILNLTSSLERASLEPFARQLSRTSLRALHLSYNRLEDIVSLAFCLERNDTLTELYLDYNQINAEGGVVLANALQTNGSLRFLQLNSNQLHDKGALAFGNMLAHHNTTLKRLYLGKNRITSRGAVSLIQAMETNVTLHHLEMSKNQIHPDILGTLELAMQTNRSGRYLLRQERVPLSLWPRVLAHVSEQPDMLYYFLQATPDLCGR